MSVSTFKQSRLTNLEKPLLSPEDSGSLHGTDEADLESQRSYSTFRNPSDEDEAVSENGSGSGNNSARLRINPRVVSDAILGLSDGLTVPFALSAGLSALGKTKVVVLGGLAELTAGAISMGLGGYVGAKSEAYVFLTSFLCVGESMLANDNRESYQTTVRETKDLIETSPHETTSIVHTIFTSHGIPTDVISQINTSLHASHDRLLDFLITFHHKESAPDCNQAWISAITLAIGYFIGGFIPLIPYFVVDRVLFALYWSIAVMGLTLLAFGYIKTCIVRGWKGKENVLAGVRGGIEMCVVGGVAAGAAIGLVRLIDGEA